MGLPYGLYHHNNNLLKKNVEDLFKWVYWFKDSLCTSYIFFFYIYYHRILISINGQKGVGTHSSIIYLPPKWLTGLKCKINKHIHMICPLTLNCFYFCNFIFFSLLTDICYQCYHYLYNYVSNFHKFLIV